MQASAPIAPVKSQSAGVPPASRTECAGAHSVDLRARFHRRPDKRVGQSRAAGAGGKTRRGREGYRLVLIHAVPAHPDSADESSLFIKRDASGEGDKAVPELRGTGDPDLVGVSDPPKRTRAAGTVR